MEKKLNFLVFFKEIILYVNVCDIFNSKTVDKIRKNYSLRPTMKYTFSGLQLKFVFSTWDFYISVFFRISSLSILLSLSYFPIND